MEKPLNKEQILQMADSKLVEIAAHGDMHKNNIEDIVEGRCKLINWLDLTKDYMMGFASPGSDMTPNYIKENQTQLRNLGFLYIRTGMNIQTKKASG